MIYFGGRGLSRRTTSNVLIWGEAFLQSRKDNKRTHHDWSHPNGLNGYKVPKTVRCEIHVTEY